MKRPLPGIDCCCWSIVFLSLAQAVPVSRDPEASESKSPDTVNSGFLDLTKVCTYDNVVYREGQNFTTSNPCETCICHPPGFACSLRSCDMKPGCKAIHTANKCCPEYSCECERNGRMYANGEKVEEPNPCKVCYCKGGEIKCALVTCYTRDDCEPRYTPGRCCPKYDHCPPLEMLKNKTTTPKPALVVISDLTTEPEVKLSEIENNSSEEMEITEWMTEGTSLSEESTPNATEPTTDEKVSQTVATLEIIEIHPTFALTSSTSTPSIATSSNNGEVASVSSVTQPSPTTESRLSSTVTTEQSTIQEKDSAARSEPTAKVEEVETTTANDIKPGILLVESSNFADDDSEPENSTEVQTRAHLPVTDEYLEVTNPSLKSEEEIPPLSSNELNLARMKDNETSVGRSHSDNDTEIYNSTAEVTGNDAESEEMSLISSVEPTTITENITTVEETVTTQASFAKETPSFEMISSLPTSAPLEEIQKSENIEEEEEEKEEEGVTSTADESTETGTTQAATETTMGDDTKERYIVTEIVPENDTILDGWADGKSDLRMTGSTTLSFDTETTPSYNVNTTVTTDIVTETFTEIANSSDTITPPRIMEVENISEFVYEADEPGSREVATSPSMEKGIGTATPEKLMITQMLDPTTTEKELEYLKKITETETIEVENTTPYDYTMTDDDLLSSEIYFTSSPTSETTRQMEKLKATNGDLYISTRTTPESETSTSDTSATLTSTTTSEEPITEVIFDVDPKNNSEVKLPNSRSIDVEAVEATSPEDKSQISSEPQTTDSFSTTEIMKDDLKLDEATSTPTILPNTETATDSPSTTSPTQDVFNETTTPNAPSSPSVASDVVTSATIPYKFAVDDTSAPVVVMISADQIQFLKVGDEPPMYVENSQPVPSEETKKREKQHEILIVPNTTPITVEMIKVINGKIHNQTIIDEERNSTTLTEIFDNSSSTSSSPLAFQSSSPKTETTELYSETEYPTTTDYPLLNTTGIIQER